MFSIISEKFSNSTTRIWG